MATRLYQHRVNSVSALSALPPALGIEIDLRADGERVIVAHDPFTRGPTIEEYFSHIGRRPCILNVKCEGIESRVQATAQECGIEDYFFLDLSVPAAVKLARAGERRLAVRYSEYEPVESVMTWRDVADWVWVDCFSRYPADAADWQRIAGAFRVCLVSPELQGHDEAIAAGLRRDIEGLPFDAVCTKVPDVWAARASGR
jgi:hypothetical protein